MWKVISSALLLAAACSSSASDDAKSDGALDASILPGPDSSRVDAGPDEPFAPGPEPSEIIRPVPGELTFYQLEMPPGLTARMGESSVIVGPDGSILLLDIGNTTHADEVREAVRELNTQWITPENGFEARDPLQVDWIIITHIHGDHSGSFNKLLVEAEPLTGLKGIVYRGFVDLGDGMNTNNYQKMCTGLRGSLSALDIPLCSSGTTPSCDYGSLESPHKVVNCDGLRMGNVESDADDGQDLPTRIDFDGVQVEFLGADGYFNDGSTIVPITPFGHDTGSQENARSVVGVIRYGDFRYHFGGDLHGRADEDGPDVESHFVATSVEHFYGELGADITHAHHHARRTSSNPTFVAAMAPNDGKSRNVVAGISTIHLGSPYQEVLDVWEENDRLGDGHIWITRSTAGGASSDDLINANGSLAIQTVQRGIGYWIQAVGDDLRAKAYESVR